MSGKLAYCEIVLVLFVHFLCSGDLFALSNCLLSLVSIFLFCYLLFQYHHNIYIFMFCVLQFHKLLFLFLFHLFLLTREFIPLSTLETNNSFKESKLLPSAQILFSPLFYFFSTGGDFQTLISYDVVLLFLTKKILFSILYFSDFRNDSCSISKTFLLILSEFVVAVN